MRALFALIVMSACGGTAPAAGPDAGPFVRGAYPAGPYGKVEGAVIESLSFVLPDGSARTLDDVWSEPSARLLLIVTGAGWCTACVEEQSALRTLDTTWRPRGLAIVEALFEDNAFSSANAALADSWKRQYALDFDVVADPPNRLGAYYDKSLAPMNMFVDVDTMKILRVQIGYDRSAVEAIIRARLE